MKIQWTAYEIIIVTDIEKYMQMLLKYIGKTYSVMPTSSLSLVQAHLFSWPFETSGGTLQRGSYIRGEVVRSAGVPRACSPTSSSTVWSKNWHTKFPFSYFASTAWSYSLPCLGVFLQEAVMSSFLRHLLLPTTNKLNGILTFKVIPVL